MKIFITGGSGFVGQHLSKTYLGKGWQVTATGTSPKHPLSGRENFTYIVADTTTRGDWQRAVAEADVIVNLAGRSIFNFWTENYKSQIYDSRILTTRHLVEALAPGHAATLLSASAAGVYGDRGDDVLAESEEIVQVDNPEEADILLLNTCSIREKAQEKVFSQLGRWKNWKNDKPDLVIGVGGCVASQEGAEIQGGPPQGEERGVDQHDLHLGAQDPHAPPGNRVALRAGSQPGVQGETAVSRHDHQQHGQEPGHRQEPDRVEGRGLQRHDLLADLHRADALQGRQPG